MEQADDSHVNDEVKCRNRHLNDPDKVFEHNAWDDVEWTEEQIEEAERIIEKQLQNKAPDDVREEFENNAAHYWDTFYTTHQDKFFKDRHWLFDEFPELRRASQANSESESTGSQSQSTPFTLFEIGCGPGNTVVPLLDATKGSAGKFFIFACDFSATAVRLLQSHSSYEANRCRAFVFDVANENENEQQQELPVTKGSCDVVLLLFVLSAVAPARHELVLRRVFEWLKPGGKVLLRDYAHYDLAELRFEPSSQRCLAKHEYARGDGTLACFFDQPQVERLFDAAGFKKLSVTIDRRLQTNRARRLKMYRAFIQAKFSKPSNSE